ncbi:MAG: Tm-1-like ATP-binding domain-containing protein [Deltaproteobacteria bacterium]|nr:Tm-1-like ATP-binding domain-containing protein [Deltaproteobacteria bacterium]
MKKNIALVGTLDTKGEESLYIKNLIEKSNYQVTTIDVGTGWRGELVFPPDYPREEVAKAGGSNMEEILSLGESGQENRIMELMAGGAIRICQQLHELGKLDGIISLGGTMGTNLGTKVMRTLPFGLPKVMLSTIASGDTRPYIGTKDIVMIPSIADIAGLNRITETTLTQAAGAVMGMAAAGKVKISEKPLIGITTLGGTTNCALQVKKVLEGKGYETVIFHANGCGGRAMEEMIEQGLIQGAFDLSPNEVVDHLYQGWGDAGPMRLEVAGRKGIPQLIAPGNIDHIIYGSPDKILERFRHQYIHIHGTGIYVLRTKKNEMIEVAKAMADKINKAKGKTAVIFPLKGLSILDKVDKEFDDPEANVAFFETLKQSLKPGVEVKEVDAHVTDSLFAEEAAEMLFKLMKEQGA